MVSLCKVSSRTLDNLRHAPQRLLFHIGGLPLSHKTVHLGSVWGCSHTKRPLTLESLSLFIRFQLRQLLNNFTRAFLANILVVIVVPTAFIWINLFISES